MDMFDKLASLDESRTSWKIKVRVTRMWPSISQSGDRIRGFNFILLDEDNYHIRAFVNNEDWKPFTTVILEGRVYEISEFYIHEASRKLRTVSSKYCIYFKKNTTVKQVNEDYQHIPLHKFEFVKLENLYNLANSYDDDQIPPNAIDVHGIVEDLKPAELLDNKYGRKHVIRFCIVDGRHKIKVTVWEEHLSSLYPLFESVLETPIIVILSSVWASLRDGYVHINTLPFSRIYINLDLPEVNAMRQRYTGDHLETGNTSSTGI